jgi:hypothetical protein
VATDSSFSAPTRVTLHRLDQAIDEAWNEISDQGRQDALRRLAEEIDVADIPAALARLATHPEADIRYQLSELLLRRWAQADAKAALAYVQARPLSTKRSALRGVCWQWANTDPKAAAEFATTLNDRGFLTGFWRRIGPWPTRRPQPTGLRGWRMIRAGANF